MNLNKWLSDNKITEVECLVSDIAGIPRGKIVPVEKYIKTSSSEGLRLPEYVFGQNVTGDYGDSNVLGETIGDVLKLLGLYHGIKNLRRKLYMMHFTLMGEQ